MKKEFFFILLSFHLSLFRISFRSVYILSPLEEYERTTNAVNPRRLFSKRNTKK